MKLFGRDFRFITVVEWLLCAASLVYGFLIGAKIICFAYKEWMIWGMHDIYNSELGRQMVFILVPLGLPFLFLAGCIWLLCLCGKRGWDINGRWRIAILVLLVAVLGIMSIDSPPIENDYTINDILPNGRDVEASYQTLMKSFSKEHPIKVADPCDMSRDRWGYWTNLTRHADIIEQAWNENAEARKVIDRLATFDVIADMDPNTKLDEHRPIPSYMALRALSTSTSSHVLLQSEEQKIRDGISDLVKLHSVACKAIPHATTMVGKMIWVKITERNITTAYEIVQRPDTSSQTMKALEEEFAPISGKDMSLRSPLIDEYLNMKNVCHTLHVSGYSDNRFCISGTTGYIYSYRMAMFATLFKFSFKPNETIRAFKQYRQSQIDGATRCPMKMPEYRSLQIEIEHLMPRLNNLGGWLLLESSDVDFSHAADVASRTKVLSDLLAIELHKRLGEPIDIPDFYSGKPYFVDAKTGKLTSVGPDGIAGTKDDIQLGQSF